MFFLVWREGGGNPTVKHPTRAEANQEAARLAARNPGSDFHVLMYERTARAEPPRASFSGPTAGARIANVLQGVADDAAGARITL